MLIMLETCYQSNLNVQTSSFYNCFKLSDQAFSGQPKVCLDKLFYLVTYKALNGLAPQYLSELLSHYSPSRPLRSQNSGHLIIPRISKSTAGGRSFSYLVPKLWNNLPNTVREADTLCQFKSRLKTHLFNLAYT